jgi:hypothetical protein
MFQHFLVRRFLTLLLIVLLTLFAAIASGQILPNLVEQALARPAPSGTTAITKATIDGLLADKSKSKARLTVRRIVREGKYAIATWQWGEAGGQSILVQQGPQWKVIGSGGGGVNLETLTEKGIPTAIAKQLIQKEQTAQKR